MIMMHPVDLILSIRIYYVTLKLPLYDNVAYCRMLYSNYVLLFTFLWFLTRATTIKALPFPNIDPVF